MSALISALAVKLPVLFVYIGWANRYDGREAIKGNHAFLQAHPRRNSEAWAFKAERGRYLCGIGRGRIAERKLHVVFVARDPRDEQRKVVGVYAAARAFSRNEAANPWWDVSTRFAALIPAGQRQVVKAWPGDSGVRRWARRDGELGADHVQLLREFTKLVARFRRPNGMVAGRSSPADQTYADLDLVEGVLRTRLIAHRTREAKLRDAKLLEAIETGRGLKCQVPGCGFDFAKRYGELGYGFAHVHHTKPLARAKATGRRTRLDDLAIVCANCHAMIHRGGECRPLSHVFRRGP